MWIWRRVRYILAIFMCIGLIIQTMGIGFFRGKDTCDGPGVTGSPTVPRRGPLEESWKAGVVGKEINYSVSGRGDAVSVVRSFKSTSCEGAPPPKAPETNRPNQQVRGKPCIDVVNTDMPQERQEFAIDAMMKAVRTVRMFRDIAEFVKKEMDKKFGSAWQCVVGREFGINISHMYGYFLFVTLDSLAILLYKTD